MFENFKIISTLLLVASSSCFSQNINSKIIDKETNMTIPYVTISYGEDKGTISNEEGDFNIVINKQITEKDSLVFSSIGYETKAIAMKEFKDSIVIMKPEILELSSVFLTNKKLNVDEILDRVKENLVANHTSETPYNKNRFFMRESIESNFKKLELDFKKSSIPEISNGLDSVMKVIPKQSLYFKETLGDVYYRGGANENKLAVIKSSILQDKNKEVSLKSVQKRMEKAISDNVKSDSYIKIKSGIISASVEVDTIMTAVNSFKKEMNDGKNKKEDYRDFELVKNGVDELMGNLFFKDDSKINIIEKDNRYKFVLNDLVTINDNLAYAISFKPRYFADLKGKLYVNTSDFGVLRIDYENTDAIYDKKFNMFGIHSNHIGYKGTMIFDKKENEKYTVKYVSHQDIESFRVERPLTIKEKNKHVKGRSKQNELKMKFNIHQINKTKKELIVFNSKQISQENYISLQENKVIELKYFSKYNEEFWKGYNIIEPNSAIKGYTSIEG